MVKIPWVTKLSSPKSLAYFTNFNKYAIQSARSRTELTFYLDTVQRTIAMVLTHSVRQELLNLAIIQKINNRCYCWIVSRYNQSKGNKSKLGSLLTSSCTDKKYVLAKFLRVVTWCMTALLRPIGTQAWAQSTNWKEGSVFPMLVTIFNNCHPFFWWWPCFKFIFKQDYHKRGTANDL